MFAGLISFWIPASIMVYVYAMVYKEMQRLQSAFNNGQHVSLSRKLGDKNDLSQEIHDQVIGDTKW